MTKKQEEYNEMDKTFDQEVFGVVGTAGQIEQDEIDSYYAKLKSKRDE